MGRFLVLVVLIGLVVGLGGCRKLAEHGPAATLDGPARADASKDRGARDAAVDGDAAALDGDVAAPDVQLERDVADLDFSSTPPDTRTDDTMIKADAGVFSLCVPLDNLSDLEITGAWTGHSKKPGNQQVVPDHSGKVVEIMPGDWFEFRAPQNSTAWQGTVLFWVKRDKQLMASELTADVFILGITTPPPPPPPPCSKLVSLRWSDKNGIRLQDANSGTCGKGAPGGWLKTNDLSKWTHVAITWTKTGTKLTLQLYVDGKAAGIPLSIMSSASRIGLLTFGGDKSGGARFGGRFDDAIYLDRALFPNQVAPFLSYSCTP